MGMRLGTKNIVIIQNKILIQCFVHLIKELVHVHFRVFSNNRVYVNVLSKNERIHGSMI